MVIRKESEICIAILSNSSIIDILLPPPPPPLSTVHSTSKKQPSSSFAFNQKLPPSSSLFTAQNLAHSTFSSQIPCPAQRCRGMNNETLYLSAGNESFKCVTRGENITVFRPLTFRNLTLSFFKSNHIICYGN